MSPSSRPRVAPALMALAALWGVAACAPVLPPKDLLDARATFHEAKRDAQSAPAELEEARRALVAADKRFEEVGAEQQVADLAFVAERKAQKALSVARGVKAEAEIAALAARLHDIEAARVANEHAELQRLQAEHAKRERELAAERAAKAEAEERAARALESLKRVAASVRADPRGMIITMAGSVLFANNQSALSAASKAKLNEVATVILRERPAARILVEGHTDTQGAHAQNMALSARRAEAVAAYLATRGIPKERVRSEGLGETRPLAENTSAAGRATNRRVEIVVEK